MHNGGRSQINFWFLEICGMFPWVNHLKSASNWGYNSGVADLDTLNSNGYPLTLTGGLGSYSTVCDIPTASEYTGNWILDWLGTGTLSIGSSETTVSGSTTGTNGQYVFIFNETTTGSGNNFRLSITATNAGDPIRQLRLYRADQTTNMAAGETWNPIFLAKLREGNPHTLRFMDWQLANVSNITLWAQRRPITYITYGGSHWFTSLWAGSSTNVGNAYSVTKVGFTLVDKAQVIFRFNADGSGASGYTLNVNGTGAKRMTYASGSNTGGGPNPNDFYGGTTPTATTVCCAMYDADLDQWLLTGGGINQDRGIYTTVPPELFIDLCNKINAHCWVCFPIYTLDPTTDFVSSLATYARDNLVPGLKARFEPSNEIWNTVVLNTAYAACKAYAHWGGLSGANDWDNWYGKVASTSGQVVSGVYGADRSRYDMIFGCWTVQNGSLGDRLAATLYVSQNGGSAASNWVTQLAITCYWGATTYTDANFTIAANNYAAAGTPEAKLAIATDNVNSCYVSGSTGNLRNGLPYLFTQFTSWQTTAAANSLTLTCYEGGYGADLGAYTVNERALILASQDVSEVYNQVTSVYNTLLTTGGVAPSQYVMCGSSGLAAHYPDIYDVTSPSWTAIVRFNNVASTPRPMRYIVFNA